MIETIKSFFNKGHERTIRAKKNVFYSLILKGLGLLIGFAYFPLSLAYLSDEKFGLFLTLASIIDWFAELNIGIGNGLRNKLGESIAEGNDLKARTYISTAYTALAGIFSGVLIVFVCVNFFLPWAVWLGADEVGMQDELALLAVFMMAALAIRFVSSLIYEVFYTLQKSAFVNVFNFLTKLLFLILLIVIINTTEESLLLFGAAKTLTFAFVPLAVGFIYFRGKFYTFRPSFKLAKWDFLKDIFTLGIQFFAIKLAMLVIHKTNNFLISGFVSPAEVPPYEAAFKYLSIFLIFFLLLTDQLWAANVEAYKKQELDWMRKTIEQTIKIWLGTVVLCGIMVAISPWVYQLWLGDELQISMSMTIIVAVSILLTTWVNLFNLVLNGTGKIRLQMYAWIVASLLNIPVSIFFATKLNMGTNGIILGTVVCLLPLAILSPIQVFKILNQQEKGIWGK